MKPRVLVTSYYDPAATSAELKRLSALAEVKRVMLGRRATPPEMVQMLKGVTGVMISDEPMSPEVIDSADDLRMIGCDGVGVDSVDVDAATRSGVLVNNAPQVHEANGEFTLGLILALLRKIVTADRDVRIGRWNERPRFVGQGLSGRILGLLGFGRAARNVALKARAFGPEIIAHSRNPDPHLAQELKVRLVSYRELIETSDILSVHVTLTNQTRRMLDERSLSKMKRGVYLVNTSRGALIDEMALVNGLKAGRIAGAALDVLTQEPPAVDHPLLSLQNVIVSPHIASDSEEAFRAVFRSLVDDFLLLMSGLVPRHVVNPSVLKHPNFEGLSRTS